MARYLASLVTAIGAYAVAYDCGKVWSYTIRSIATVRVDFKSDEAVKKLDDVGCMFLP